MGVVIDMTHEMLTLVGFILLAISWLMYIYLLASQRKVIDNLTKKVAYWRNAALSMNSSMRRRANFKLNNPRIGGDESGYYCTKCNGKTEFEEYAPRDGSHYSDLGLHCIKCNHREEPVDFYERFK